MRLGWPAQCGRGDIGSRSWRSRLRAWFSSRSRCACSSSCSSRQRFSTQDEQPQAGSRKSWAALIISHALSSGGCVRCDGVRGSAPRSDPSARCLSDARPVGRMGENAGTASDARCLPALERSRMVAAEILVLRRLRRTVRAQRPVASARALVRHLPIAQPRRPLAAFAALRLCSVADDCTSAVWKRDVMAAHHPIPSAAL